MKNLIEKYFNGETSLQEEDQLKTYFNSGKVDPNLKDYQPLFQYFEKEKEVELGEGFDKNLFSKLDGEAKIVRFRSWGKRLAQVAAVGAVLFAAHLFLSKPPAPSHPIVDWSQYEINDEQLAYQETIKALRLLSSKINKGKNKAYQEVQKTEPVIKYFN